MSTTSHKIHLLSHDIFLDAVNVGADLPAYIPLTITSGYSDEALQEGPPIFEAKYSLDSEQWRSVLVKIAIGTDSMDSLAREYAFNTEQLLGLQGKELARCLGYFEGSLSGNGIACILFEWDKPSANEESILPADDYPIIFLETMSKVHRAGISLNLSAEVAVGSSWILNGQQLLADFSSASTHVCLGVPADTFPPQERTDTESCAELVGIKDELDYGQRRSSVTSSWSAY